MNLFITGVASTGGYQGIAKTIADPPDANSGAHYTGQEEERGDIFFSLIYIPGFRQGNNRDWRFRVHEMIPDCITRRP